jgi:hypothetical protein
MVAAHIEIFVEMPCVCLSRTNLEQTLSIARITKCTRDYQIDVSRSRPLRR